MAAYAGIMWLSVAVRSVSQFPWETVFSLLCLLLVVGLPLHVLGTLLGRTVFGNPHYPCRTSAIPSAIPASPFYSRHDVLCVVSGILPFGCVFIEVFFVFASIWSYKYYYMYGFLLAMTGMGGNRGFFVVILTIIEVCESIVATYLLLNSENYHWRWASFANGASLGVYLFLYCLYYYFRKTHMKGLLQTLSFFTESVGSLRGNLM